jgi:Ca-activated chloride channel homolog
MNFAQPVYLACLIPLLLLGLLLVFLNQRKARTLARIGESELLARLSTAVNWPGRRWKMLLWFLALTSLIVALARPRWGTEVDYVERQGIEIMIALDVSESMLAQDVKPNRLERGKLEIVELMERLEGNEIGLVLFSGAAFVQFPLTADFSTARAFLDAARPGIISRPGTALGEAIEIATTGFNDSRATQRVIILLTDGESHEGDVLNVARQAAEQGIVIFAIGFGSPQGEPIPIVDRLGKLRGYKTDAEGQTILTRLDETTLQQIARVTNGLYFWASADGREVGFLASAIDDLQKSTLESRFETRGIERFQWFVLVAVLALVAGELIPDRLKSARAKSLSE